MKAKYVGHPDFRDETPRTTSFGGVTFRRGLFVPVPETFDAKLAAKLSANPGFEVSDREMTDAETEALEAAETAAPSGTPTTNPATPGALDKPALLAALADLKEKHPDAGVDFTDKMGVAKLRQVLEEARFIIGDDE